MKPQDPDLDALVLPDLIPIDQRVTSFLVTTRRFLLHSLTHVP